MSVPAVKGILFVALLSLAFSGAAQVPGKVDAQSAELVAELIGAPVFARDGEQVGEVKGLAFDDEGQPRELRMRTTRHLGLGTRMVHVPEGTFVVLRGAVSLEMPADAVYALPEVIDPPGETR
jgi:hypothetical protein